MSIGRIGFIALSLWVWLVAACYNAEATACASTANHCVQFGTLGQSASAASETSALTGVGAHHTLCAFTTISGSGGSVSIGDTFSLSWSHTIVGNGWNSTSFHNNVWCADTGTNTGSTTITFSAGSGTPQIAVIGGEWGAPFTLDTSGQSGINSTGSGTNSITLTLGHTPDIVIGYITNECDQTTPFFGTQQINASFAGHWNAYVYDASASATGSFTVNYTEKTAGCFDSNPYSIAGLAINGVTGGFSYSQVF